MTVTAFFAFVGALVSTLADYQRRDYDLRGYVDPTQTRELPFRIPRLGVNVELTQYDPVELEQQLEFMEAAGVRWLRQKFAWTLVEAEPGIYEWEQYDLIVSAANARPGIDLVAVLVTSPLWARESGSSPTTPPDDIENFRRFVEQFIKRYGSEIDYYQVWDEPNIADGWGGGEPQPVQYAAMLKMAYTAIHRLDPGAIVLAAALAPTEETGPQNVNEVDYLQELYASGLAGFSDAIAAKPYGFSTSPSDREVAVDTLNFSRIVLLREVMVAHGDAQKALWASNWGWNSLPPEWDGEESIWGQVSQQQRIQFTLDAIDRADREWPWLGGLILHHWQPDAPESSAQWGFALIDRGGNPGMLWSALTERAAAMPSVASNGLFPAQNPYAQYSGIWTFSEIGADIGWVEDSVATFDFAGTDLALLLRQGDYLAYLYPLIDGENANELPVDTAGNSFLSLQSDDGHTRLSTVAVAHDLQPGLHTLHLTADELIPDEIARRWPLVGFAVSSGNLAQPYNRQIAIGLLASVVSLMALIYAVAQLGIDSVSSQVRRLNRMMNSVSQMVIGAVASIALMLGMLMTWGEGVPLILRREPVPLLLSILTSGLIYINEFGIIITIVAAALLFVMIFNRIDLGLLLTIFWSPFFLFPVELYQFAFPTAEIILLLTAGAWLLKLLAGTRRHLDGEATALHLANPLPYMTSLDWSLLTWVILAVVSLSWADRLDFALTELRTLIFEPALFFLIFRTVQPGRPALFRMAGALMVAGVAVAIIGIVMWVQGEGVITAEAGTRRLVSVYGSPNNVGLFLGRVLPFWFVFMLVETSLRNRLFAGIGFALCGTAILMTQSAGAIFIGVPVSLAVVLLLVYGRRAALPLLALGALLIISISIAANTPRFQRITDFTSGTNFYRLRVWESALNLVEDHPLTGAGLDQFLYEFRDTYMMPDAWEEPDLSHPHNVILDWWVRLGVGGVLVFMATQFTFWKRVVSTYRRIQKETLLYPLVLAVAGSMMNLLAHGLVDHSVFVNDLAIVYVLLLGLSIELQNNSAIDGMV